MKNQQIRDTLLKVCANKVKICTEDYCAYGCLDQEFSEDFMIRLNDVKVVQKNGDNEKIEYKDSMTFSDDKVIYFEPYTNLN